MNDNFEMSVVLPTSYLPSIEYFTLLATADKPLINIQEFYQKQTLRNRCFILSPNGIQCLVVPIMHTGEKQHTAAVRISYAAPWQQQHLRSLKTAYARSPFYEYYEEELNNIIQKKFEFLFELNAVLLQWLLSKAGIGFSPGFTITNQSFTAPFDQKISNTATDRIFSSYNQVFSYKFGFTPNLSIIDLLFNKGKDVLSYLSNPFTRQQ